MLLKQFFDGLSDAEEGRYYVKYLQRPQSIDEAVGLMQEYQGCRGNGKAMRCHPMCMVRPADDDDDDDNDDEPRGSQALKQNLLGFSSLLRNRRKVAWRIYVPMFEILPKQ